MSDLIIEHNTDREHECHGHNSLHPMVIEQDHPIDPFDLVTRIIVVVWVLFGIGMLLASLFRP
jgi:hypothetical protein